MKSFLRRVRGALGMGLTWAVSWFVVGMVIELVHNIWPNPLGYMVDIWPAVLAYPAFVCGVVFSVMLGIVARRRRFDELSLPQFALWGAVGGALVSLVPVAMVALGLATATGSLWTTTAAVLGPVTILSAISSVGSLALARRAEVRALRDADAEVSDVGLTEGEMRDLLGRGG